MPANEKWITSFQGVINYEGGGTKICTLVSAKPTGIICHDVETSRQRALGLGLGSFALAGNSIVSINFHLKFSA